MQVREQRRKPASVFSICSMQNVLTWLQLGTSMANMFWRSHLSNTGLVLWCSSRAPLHLKPK
jgi:hypothetical protein